MTLTLRGRIAAVAVGCLLWLAAALAVSARAGAADDGGVAAQQEHVILRLEVSPSAILSDNEIAVIRNKYEGTPVSVERLQALLAEFDALYAGKGYLAVATLPEQTLEGGVLRVELVEARVGRILLEGNQSTRDDYVLSRLGVGPGDLVHLGRLDEAISYFNRTNDVRLHAQLSPGAEPGTSDVLILVHEPAVRDQWQLHLHPPGATQKHWSGSVTWHSNSFTGRRDVLSATAVHGSGTWAGTLSYSVPLSLEGLRLGLVNHTSSGDVLNPDGSPTPFQRRVSQAAVSLSQPWPLTETVTTIASIEWQARRTDVLVAGHPQTSVSVRSLTAGYTVQSQRADRTWALHHALRGGVWRSSSGGVDHDPVYYHKYNMSGQAVGPAPGAGRWAVRGTLQYAFDKSLQEDERFALGGVHTVRGIREGAVHDQRGYAATVEYRYALNEKLEIAGFLDHGRAWPVAAPGEEAPGQSFTSIGLGLDWRPVPNALVSVVIGVPLGSVNDQVREPLHAQVRIAF